MSNPYYNPGFPPGAYPTGANMSNPGAQLPFISSDPSLNMYPQYPLAQPAMVQHVMVPVALPVQPGQTDIQNSNQFHPSRSTYRDADSSRARSSRKSEELSYYLGNSSGRRSRSRSADRYSDEREKSRHSHSRKSDYDNKRTSKSSRDYHTDRDYHRHSRSSQASRSPEGSRHSRHSVSHKHDDRARSHRRSESPGYSQGYSRDVKEYPRGNEYRDNVSTDERYYEDEYTSKSRESERQQYYDEDELSDRHKDSEQVRYSDRHRHDRYDDDDTHDEGNRRKKLNESKRVLEDRSRRDESNMVDYSSSKRRKHEHNIDEWSDRGDKSYRGDYSRNRNYEKQSDYAEEQHEVISDSLSNKSSDRIKVHVDNHGRWIESNREASPISDGEISVDLSRKSAHIIAGYDDDLNITVENDRINRYDRDCSRRATDDGRGSSINIRSRPKIFEDGVEITEPRIFEDGVEVAPTRRYDRLNDSRSDKGSTKSGHGRARLYEDRISPRRDVDLDWHENSRSSDHRSRSYDSRPHMDEFENISDSGSIGQSCNTSQRNYSKNRSPVLREDRYDRSLLSSRTPPPHQVGPLHTEQPPSGYFKNTSVATRPFFPKIDIDFEVPKLCLDYNAKNGCHDPKCPKWHVCRHFVINKCAYSDGCKRGHNFFVGEVYQVLFEINNRKIDFLKKNMPDLRYKIIGKLREQLRNVPPVQPVKLEIKPSKNDVKVDPEFDASNYKVDGEFKKSVEVESKTETASKHEENSKAGVESSKTGTSVETKEVKDEKPDKGSESSDKCKTENKQDEKINKDTNTNEKDKTEVSEEKAEESKEQATKESDKVTKEENKNVIQTSDKDKCKDNNTKSAEIDRNESLSPVSVENIENWDEYERYERVSEDGSLDMDLGKADRKDELENISSDEEVQNNDVPLNHHNILAKAAIPIGINDPLVFNPSKNAPPTALPNRPIGINEPLPIDVRRPPPRIALNSSPLFPSAQSMGPPMRNMIPFPHPLPTHPPPMIPLPHHQIAVQNPPVNFLPPPSILLEVIESLQTSKTKQEQQKATRPKRKCSGDLESLAEKNPELTEVIQTPWQFPHKGMLNMTMIDFVTETEAYKEEFVAELLRILITLDLPYVTIKKLMVLIREKMSINIKSPVDLRKILGLYSESFQVIETVESDDEDESSESLRKNIQIKARVSLGFCERHGYLPFAVGKCSCNALHICKFYFLSSCPKQRCKFGHKLKTDHNMTVFRSHKLHRMTFKEVMTFIRDADNRHVEMVPEICRFYCREKGECYKGDNLDVEVMCHKLHLCLFYAKGNCYKRPCPKSHCIRDRQPFTLLQMYGLDPDVLGEKRVVQMLNDMTQEMERKKAARNAPCQSKRKENDKAGNTVDTGETEKSNVIESLETENSKISQAKTSPNKVARAVKTLNLKLPTVCKFYNNELGCKKRDWGPRGYCMFIHVCQFFVSGECKFGDKCKRSHDLLSGQASLLLQKHGLETSQFLSREIADMLHNPDELLKQVAVTESPVRTDSDTKVISSALKEVTGKASETKEKYEKAGRGMGVVQSTSFKSYSVEDILEQIVERGKQEEQRKADLMKSSEISEKESPSDSEKK